MTDAPTISIAPLSTGGLVRLLNKPAHVIRWAIRSRNIQATHVIAGRNLYSAETVEKIRAALSEIENSKKEKTHGNA